ncbi:MAG: DNA-binding protein containing wHTH domain [Lokiarchaeia virus VerdaV4]|uniref:DNA-binding protein containing wHTH domain n=1 Tax=Lokiarchaeia virus VerdaV4 TaxID=3070172 RepID=A0AA35CNQ1_9CAUD|nr:MAG: DNA-binding protein containing wHTH domain [Lokiarchaeia virus VerdaV4]BDI54978.1 MAG: DNA-binding protein containing wHTH domain [Lokiarchaeia virus VerdaV4]
MKTFEEIALDKLKELEQPTTRREWSEALGYKTPNAFYHTLMKLIKSNKVVEIQNKRPYKYQIIKKAEGK